MATRPLAASHDWTVADLHALPDDGNRYEIIDGVLCVTASPLLPHQRLLSRLHFRLMAYVENLGLEVLESPSDIVFSDDTLVQPDLFVFPKLDGRSAAHFSDIECLTLAVEVLSRSTARRDRTTKRRLYQQQGVPEYWVADTRACAIERWRPESTEAEVITENLVWQPVAGRVPLVLELPKLFRGIAGG